jgi:hypothetical protein
VFNFEVCLSGVSVHRFGRRISVKLPYQCSGFVNEKADLCAVRRDRSDPNCLPVFVINRFPPLTQFTVLSRL